MGFTMKKYLILPFLFVLTFGNDGFFVGIGGGMTKAQFEAKNYTNKNDLSQRYDIDETFTSPSFDLIVGYKSFFNDYFGYRIYGEVAYHWLGKVNAPEQSTAKGVDVSVLEFGANADFVIKPFNWLGVYAGGFVSSIELGDIYHQGYSSFNRNPAEVGFGGVNYGVNAGVDFSFGTYQQHSFELYSKINFYTIKADETIQFRDISNYATAHTYQNLPTIEAKFNRSATIGLRYVYYFVSNSYENKIDAKRQREKERLENIKNACPNFERDDLEKIKNNEEYLDDELKKGIVRVEDKTLYCAKLKVLSRKAETRNFAVNNSSVYDFNAKITKETIKAQKVKNGKVVENNINIVQYKIEPVKIVSYGGLLYKENAPQLENIRQQLKSKYINARKKELIKKRVCISPSNNVYCDGDLVEIKGKSIMIRLIETGYGSVRYNLYFYQAGQPIREADYRVRDDFEMLLPKVYGNHYLDSIEEEKLPYPYLLNIHEVATFKEW